MSDGEGRTETEGQQGVPSRAQRLRARQMAAEALQSGLPAPARPRRERPSPRPPINLPRRGGAPAGGALADLGDSRGAYDSWGRPPQADDTADRGLPPVPQSPGDDARDPGVADVVDAPPPAEPAGPLRSEPDSDTTARVSGEQSDGPDLRTPAEDADAGPAVADRPGEHERSEESDSGAAYEPVEATSQESVEHSEHGSDEPAGLDQADEAGAPSGDEPRPDHGHDEHDEDERSTDDPADRQPSAEDSVAEHPAAAPSTAPSGGEPPEIDESQREQARTDEDPWPPYDHQPPPHRPGAEHTPSEEHRAEGHESDTACAEQQHPADDGHPDDWQHPDDPRGPENLPAPDTRHQPDEESWAEQPEPDEQQPDRAFTERPHREQGRDDQWYAEPRPDGRPRRPERDRPGHDVPTRHDPRPDARRTPEQEPRRGRRREPVGAAYARPRQETQRGAAAAGSDPQAEERRWPRWPVFAGIALVMVVAGVAGYGAADFLKQRQQWERTTASDVDDAGADLSLAVASMRKVSYEVTPKDLTTWLQHPRGYGSQVRLRVLSSEGDTVQVAGYRTWQDHIVKRTHTARSCASIELRPGIQHPVTTTATACPDTAPKTAPAPARGKGGELAGPVEKARTHREKGSATGLLAIAPPTKPVGDVTQDSTSLMCAPGTTDVGTTDGYVNGKKIPIRLCAVADLPSSSEASTPGNKFFVKGADGHALFNARVSGAIVALLAEARRDGLHLSATSSFRSMPQQQDTCVHDMSKGCPKGDYTYVAQPGYSNHQDGVAVDFVGTTVPGKDSCTAGRAKDPSSKVWQFLNQHALEFGFRQYAPESWHWDVMTDPDRCNPL